MITFSALLTESQPNTFTPAMFPSVIASWKQSGVAHYENLYITKGRLQSLCDELNKYRSGDVPNPRYLELKDKVNRFVEDAMDLREPILDIWREAAYISGWDSGVVYGISGAHELLVKLKRVEQELAKNPSGPVRQILEWAVTLMRELKPVAEAVADMKTRAVKRKAAAPVDGRQKYVAPMMRGESGRLVIEALTDITNAIYTEFAEKVTASYIRDAERYLAADMDGRRKSQSIIKTMPIWERTTQYAKSNQERHDALQLKPNYKAVLAVEGEKAAKFMQEQFVIKNAKKLANIIDKKTSPLVGKPKIGSTRVDGNGYFQGDLHIVFEDGSSFVVLNKVVFKYSIYGKPFLQFPTTFHDVTMPDGKPMGQPSEERMNTVFAVA